MALLRDVIFKRGLRTPELLELELGKFNLKALSKVTIRFDPFREKVQHTRIVASLLYKEKVFSKNQKCLIKTEVLNDRSEPTITAEAINGETFLIKCENLHFLDIFRLMNKYITPLAPAEEELATILTKTGKLTKKK